MILQNDSISEVRSAVRQWVALLAEGRFEEAASEISSPASPCSAQLLRDAIGRYSRKYRDAPENEKTRLFPLISSPYVMDNQGENLALYPKADFTVVEYDIPIENCWSDLTSKFRLTRLNEKHIELSLVDIRVL